VIGAARSDNSLAPFTQENILAELHGVRRAVTIASVIGIVAQKIHSLLTFEIYDPQALTLFEPSPPEFTGVYNLVFKNRAVKFLGFLNVHFSLKDRATRLLVLLSSTSAEDFDQTRT
jgi:hypothetical protein